MTTLAAPIESKARPRGGFSLRALALVLAAILLLPVATVLLHLVLPDQGTWAHLSATVLPDYLINSALLALSVGITVPVIGTGTAWLVTLCRFPGRGVFAWALILPLALPGYVIAYAYSDWLSVSGPVQSLIRDLFDLKPGEYWFPDLHSVAGAGLLLSAVLYPYCYLMARTAFLEQSVCALEVGRTLGHSPWQLFWRVALPLARPGIVAGTALALMETLADYGTVAYLGVTTMATGVVRSFVSLGDPVAAAQLASVLFLAVAGMLFLERWSRARQRFHDTSGKSRPLPRFQLKGLRAAGAFLACFIVLSGGFLLPVALLLHLAIDSNWAGLTQRFFHLAGNSLVLSLVTAVAAISLALALAYGLRNRPSRLLRFAARLCSMGYALPGAVVAIGVLIPFSLFDNAFDAWSREHLGVSTGLILTGSIAALVFAYLVRFLSVSLSAVEASLGRIRPSLDDAARSLGETPGGVLRRVHAPLIWSGLLAGALLIFQDVMKELPATLLLRPFNFDTLAVQAYNFAADERLAEAAVPSLLIVLVGLFPVIYIARRMQRGRPSDKK